MMSPEHAVPQPTSSPVRHFQVAGWRAGKATCAAQLTEAAAAEHDSTLLVSPIHLLRTGRLCGGDLGFVVDRPVPAASLSPAVPSLIEAACHEAQAWQADATRPDLLRLSVALPVTPAQDRALAARIRHAIESADLPPGALELTLAEEDGADQSRELLLFVSALRDLGIGLALDRVRHLQEGVAVLRRLPLTSVRLHPSLVDGLSCDTETRTALRQTIRMAHGLGATTLALGVATSLQRDILGDMRCDEAQGTLYDASPLVPSAFRAALGSMV